MLSKEKKILGSFFKTIERDDGDIIKVINKRTKLEKDKVAKELELRIQQEASEGKEQNIDKVETENVKTVGAEKVDNLNNSTSKN